MKKRFQQWGERIDRLSIRERGLVFAAVLVVLIMPWYSLFLVPMEKHQTVLEQRSSSIQQQVQTKQLEAQQIVARFQADPNRAVRQRIGNLKDEIRKVEDEIRRKAGDLVEPTRMSAVLEDLLNRQKGLKLVKLETLPPEPIKLEGQDEKDPDVAIYRHGMLIEFKGDYVSTLHYLQAVEAMPWRLFWDGMELTVEDYPTARVVLRVHTLSTSKGWLGV